MWSESAIDGFLMTLPDLVFIRRVMSSSPIVVNKIKSAMKINLTNEEICL